MVSALVPKKIMDTEPQLIKTLQKNNETLQNINVHFLDIYEQFQICMVHEAVKTDLKGTRAFIVDQESASPLLRDVQYFGIEATHSDMCKFESKNSPGYLNVSTTIKSWVQECLPVIQSRQEEERIKRQRDKEAQAKELLGIYGHSVSCDQPSCSANTDTPQPLTPQKSNETTPGTSYQQGLTSQQANRQPGLIDTPRTRTTFEFEVAEVEERDTEMAGNH